MNFHPGTFVFYWILGISAKFIDFSVKQQIKFNWKQRKSMLRNVSILGNDTCHTQFYEINSLKREGHHIPQRV